MSAVGRTDGPWCHAPSTALYFAPDGTVLPCCAGGAPFGTVTGPNRASLREIWAGVQAERVRAAVAVGDLGAGCSECATVAAVGGRAATMAATFDRYRPDEGPWPLHLDLALSNTCNLQCVMCHGGLSSAIRSRREGLPPLPSAYDDRFFDELDEFLPHAERVVFKGGEPLLARESRRVMDRLLAIGSTAEVDVTTNGTIWSDRVEQLVHDLRIAPVLSVDALDRQLLAEVRVGVDPDAFWRNVDRFDEAARSVGRRISFSYCLMRSTSQELAPLLVEAERRGAGLTVVLVTQPSGEALGAAGAEELDRALRGLERQGHELQLGREDLRLTWDRALDQVRSWRDDRGADRRAGTATPVAAPQARRPPGRLAEALAELRAWAGVEPVVVSMAWGEIVSVEAPDWAGGWGAGRWPQARANDLQALVEAVPEGVAPRALTVSIDERGATVASLVDGDGVEVVRAVADDAGPTVTVHLARRPPGS